MIKSTLHTRLLTKYPHFSPRIGNNLQILKSKLCNIKQAQISQNFGTVLILDTEQPISRGSCSIRNLCFSTLLMFSHVRAGGAAELIITSLPAFLIVNQTLKGLRQEGTYFRIRPLILIIHPSNESFSISRTILQMT